MPLISPQDVSESTLQSYHQLIALMDSPMLRRNLASACTAKLHQGTSIKVLVPYDELAGSRPSYTLVRGKVLLHTDKQKGFNVQVPCFVACGRRLERKRSEEKEINLVDYFDQLLPQSSGVGLFTCQNGIQNDTEDFEDMCNSIRDKLSREKPLFIGLHNESTFSSLGMPKQIGILHDLERLIDSWTSNPQAILSLRQMFVTIGIELNKLRPRLCWAHIAHSEGGLLANRCLTNQDWGLSREQQKLMKRHLITLVYGGVDSIPNSAVLQASNTYSYKDIALRFAKPYIDEEKLRGQKSFVSTKNGRTIKVEKCLTKDPPIIEGDHSIMDTTYQTALASDFESLRSDRGILS